MSNNDKRFTALQNCNHCGNRVSMEIVARYTSRESDDDFLRDHLVRETGNDYQLLLCAVCDGVTLRSCSSHDQSADPLEIEFKTLYPLTQDGPRELPESIGRMRIAQSFRNVDPKAHSVMLRHLAIIHECNKTKRV